MIKSKITHEQELTVQAVVLILALISLFYGAEEENLFWLAVAPTLLIGGLAFFARRQGSHFGGERGTEDQSGNDTLSRLNTLERLVKLHRDGALTAEEFDAEKQKLLMADK